ncbi:MULTISPECIES: DUF3857 domain-containing protein [Bacteroides]|jgi:hypothetical protein|uniref:DUF3857 domain-containing protein n=1 Tax=Bacteroides TaxID=816 RepID=UPI000E4C371A|nr:MULTISPECIES: DUF3857 domain-containing protein [Bacteroides]QNL38912.1 DUF3857 domain-containing protein [Bacteroides sp. M10]RGY32696.1 DUF3857 domain-containing protein [Bacteroides sp. OF02-3LB]
MRKLFILCAFLLQFLSPVHSQQATTATIEPNLKYGKPSKEELSLTSYAPDTTATAIYLFHQGQSDFVYHDGFQLTTEHWVRIKILKPQGVSYADVSVPYYSPTDKDEGQERASDIEGCSYNMENGKCIKTSMKRESISFERINNLYKMLKFSLPAVKEGTVIEYHYKLYSDYFSHIDNWMMQEELPMLYNQYKITIPHVFIYNIELRGKDYIQVKQRDSSIHATEREGGSAGVSKDFTVSAQETTFTSRNLPAIRQDEPYCWCPEDYKVQVSFDLQGTQFTPNEYKPYSQKWEDVDNQLLKPENTQFGKYLSFTNPFRPETKQAYNSEMSFEEKIICAFQVLKKKMAWNGRYQLYSKELEKVISKGNGSNADLNFILISILKDFGLEAYPVVMSRRSSGILPYHFPSLQKLNTFIVAVYDINKQKYVFLDSSMDVPALNILPLELSVNKARILSPKETEEKKWVDVMALADNKSFMKIEARLEGNQVKGHRSTILYGQEAVEYQANEKHKQDSIVSNPESNGSLKNKLTVTNLKVKKQENDRALIEEEFDFVLQTDRTDDHLYINPMLFPHLKSNPFIQTERVLPIEFPYPYKFTMLATLTLPEGYEVEETPQPQVIRTQGDGLQCKYMIQRQGNTISLNYIFYLKEPIFLTEQYKQLQELWTKVIEKNNALIVLKKL